MSAPEESKDTTEAAPAEKIEIDEVNSANLQINYKFSFNFLLNHCHHKFTFIQILYIFIEKQC